MNEMGAAWMRQNDFLLLATPTFDYKNDKFQRGVANPQSLAVSMNNIVLMRQFIEHIKELFGIDVGEIQVEAALKEYFTTLDQIEGEKKVKKENESKPVIRGLENIVKDKPRKDLEFIALGRKMWTQDRNYPAAVQQYSRPCFLGIK